MLNVICKYDATRICYEPAKCSSHLGGEKHCVLVVIKKNEAIRHALRTEQFVANVLQSNDKLNEYSNNGDSHHDDPNANLDRITHMTLNLRTFGTDAQRRATIERLKKELELQGFVFSIQVISYT